MSLTGMDAINAARAAAKAAGGSSGDFGFFKLGDGESQILRFLTGIDPMVIFSHGCGLNNWELSERRYAEMQATGQPVQCPVCQQTLTEENIVGKRPGIIATYVHEFVTSPKDGKSRTYVCLNEHKDSAGNPLYPCPICAQVDSNGKVAKPAKLRVYGAAVIRDAQVESQTVNGVPMQRIVGASDRYIEVDDNENQGQKKLVKAVVMVQQGVKNFWNSLVSVFEHEGSIAYYDFKVTRIGADTSTTYQIDKVNSEPMPLDFSGYEDSIPDIAKFLSNIGDPEYYTKNGFSIPGYTPKQQQQQPQGFAQQYGQQMPPAQQYTAPPMQAQQCATPQQYAPVGAVPPVMGQQPMPAPVSAAPAPVQPAPAPMPTQQPAPAPVQPAPATVQSAPSEQPAAGTAWQAVASNLNNYS